MIVEMMLRETRLAQAHAEEGVTTDPLNKY